VSALTNVLYIEDDQDIGVWVQQYLEERNYAVVWLRSGEGALEASRACQLVILDVMLPGLDGFTIGQRLKKERPELPILMLSTRTSIDDKLQGLNFADDYVTKPFHPDELIARMEVLLRRSGAVPEEALQLGHVTVYPPDHRIVNRDTGEEITLTGKQYYIFAYFLRHLVSDYDERANV
jgi:DNA-binding response OmpR family regulator